MNAKTKDGIVGDMLVNCIRYAIDRLTDNDFAGCPPDMRHKWVKEASDLINTVYRGKTT